MQQAAGETAMQVAMIGVGGFGAHRRGTMRRSKLFRIVAAMDHNPAVLAKACEEEGAHPAGSLDELLATPGLEALFVSSGAKFHAEQALAAMERGLPVFIEKPLCGKPDEVRALLAAQARTGLPVGMGHNDLHADPSCATIRRLIDDGELGTVVAAEATTCHSGGFHIKPGDWRGDPETNPGGMLFQCGVHSLHELMFYLGPVSHVSCMMRFDVLPRTATADAAVCTLRFARGAVATLNAYHVTPYRTTLSIFGTKANLYRDENHREGASLFRQDAPPDYNGSLERRVPVTVPEKRETFGALERFHAAVRSGRKAPSEALLEGARAVAIVFAADEAARTGRTVALAEAWPELF